MWKKAITQSSLSLLHGCVLLLIRYGSIELFDLTPIIFPDPLLTTQTFFQNALLLGKNSLYTITITLIGIMLSSITTFILWMLFYYQTPRSNVLFLYLTGLRSLPIVALAPFLTVRIGTGSISHSVLSFLAWFFPLLLNFLTGLQSADPDLLRYLKQKNASTVVMRTVLLLPASLKHFFTGLKITVSLCLIGTIVGEFISSQQGLWYLIKSSMYYLDTPLALCALILIFLLWIVLFQSIERCEKRIIFW